MTGNVGSKLGEGGCSEIFEWEGPEKILKLAKANTNRHAMSREHQNSQMAWKAGLPAPRPYEFVEIDGRPGIVFERVRGETVMDRFVMDAVEGAARLGPGRGTKRTEDDIRLAARIMGEIHSKPGEDFPDQRSSIEESILRAGHLGQGEKEAVIRILEAIPAKRQLCHGDPNPRNIFVQDGRAVMIDWMNATCGNPEADLAEYVVMVKHAVLPPEVPRAVADYLNSIREWLIEVFMDEYEKLTGVGYNDVDPWIAPVAARKLTADAISEEEKTLLVEEVRRRIGN